MKIRSLILGALAVLGLMTSCSMEEDVTPSVPNIVLSDEYLYFEHAGGEFTLALASTADWYAETYEDWITVSPSSGWGSSEAQPVTISVLPNEEAYERYGDVWFYVEGHSVYVTVCQEGNYSYDEGIVDVTVAEFIEKEVSTDHWYRITGTVGGPINAIYGNFDIIDETGTVYVYGISNWSDYSEIFAVGGTVTVVGQRGDYNGKVEVLEGYIEYYEPGEDTGDDEPSDGRPSELIAATVADFLAAEVSTEVWYELTGEITSIVEGNAYGNLYINDGTGEVYIYGLTNGWVGYNDKSFESIGLKVGDIVTIGTLRGEYKGTPQGGGSSVPAYYISHESSEAEDPEKTILTLTNAEICAAMTSTSYTYEEYTIESASGVWTVNACRHQDNTFLQCRGKKGAYIKTPEFENDIKSVTLYFSEAKSVYSDNTYCVFPSSWTVPTEDAAYPEDGNVGKAVTDGSYILTIPVDSGNKQVYISLIRTNAYYLDHIDVEL